MYFACRSSAGLFLAVAALTAQVNSLTYQYDNTRAGANLAESLLTLSNVNVKQFGKLFSYPVDGEIYGQPLYLAGVNIPGRGIHNAVYVATEHDSVYAFDADTNSGPNAGPLWVDHFLNPPNVTTVPASDTNCDQITPEIGITSTPVIDPGSGTIYVVAMTKESSGGGVTYVHRLHALDLASGAEKPGSPVTIQATYPGTGEGGKTLVFNAKNYKQRPGLLLLNGVVYTAWSSHCDIGAYHGWLIGYDASTLEQVAIYNNTPNGNEGSFWAGGAAPASDANGNIYLVAGNGTFDAQNSGKDLGESFIKLSSLGGLSAADYFAPFNFQSLNDGDADVGSAGVALLPDEAGSAAHPHLMVGAGKEGRIYVLDRDQLGKWQAGSDSQAVASLAGAIGGLFGNPAYFAKTVYFCGSGDRLRAFPLFNATLGNPSSQSAIAFGYPGCVPTVSANGGTNGIVWVLEPSGAARAYDARNLATELWDSNQNAARDALGSYVKFSVPAVVNGKLYAGSQKALAVYGLISTLSVGNAASGQATLVAPGSMISIYGVNGTSGTFIANGFPLPNTLGGLSVSINNTPAPLIFVNNGQINAQVPFETPLGGATVAVSQNGAVIANGTIVVQASAPGLYLLSPTQAAALNQDFSINGPAHPAAAGSVIAAYMTGLGALDIPVGTGQKAPASPLSHVDGAVTAAVGGQPAVVQFAGLAPGFAALYQVNVQVPSLAPGSYPLIVTVRGIASNAGYISVN